jgi:hypothetical protein
VEHLTHANMWLYPLAVLKRLAERFFLPADQSDLAIAYGGFDRLLGAVLSSEARWVGRRLPFGLSLVALARKPG